MSSAGLVDKSMDTSELPFEVSKKLSVEENAESSSGINALNDNNFTQISSECDDNDKNDEKQICRKDPDRIANLSTSSWDEKFSMVNGCIDFSNSNNVVSKQ